MRRWFLPAVLVLFLLMLDTAVLPIFITSVYYVPLTLVMIVCLGASAGRIPGMLYGLFAGLLIDILVGYPLGMRSVQYIAAGFLSGLIVHVTDEERLKHGFRPGIYALRLALFSLGYFLLSEVVLAVYQYFNTARFVRAYAVNAGVRVLLSAALVMILYLPINHAVQGRRGRKMSARPRREVRHF